jgi:hypothetical protein
MLGSFLEVGLSTTDIRVSCEFYERLGFGTAVTGDIWTHHYGVMTCRGLCLGLHELRRPSPWLALARENVAQLARELEAQRLSPSSARLGSEVFNELELRDPAGLVLRVLEARSFSPPARVPPVTALGGFEALSLPLRDFSVAEGFWERLGYPTRAHAEPWATLQVEDLGLPLRYHAPKLHPEPLLLFSQQDLGVAREVLADLGLAAAPGLGGFGTPEHLLLESPEGLPIALLA